MVASAEAITQDSEKYVEQLLQLFRRFSLLVNQVDRWRFNFIPFRTTICPFQKKSSDEPYDTRLLNTSKLYVADASKIFFPKQMSFNPFTALLGHQVHFFNFKAFQALKRTYLNIFSIFQGFRDDPRFLTARDKAYKRVVNDTSIFKVNLPLHCSS